MSSGDDDEWDVEEWGFPPPPPPPSLGGPPLCDLAHCAAGGPEGRPAGAHFDRATFPSLPVVAVCSSVVLVAVLVASFLFWRHKSKVQNLLPCKTEQQGGGGHMGDHLGAANGVTYEDILAGHHHTARMAQAHLTASQTLMPLEILDVKLGDLSTHPHITALHHAPCYPPSRETPHHLVSKPPFPHPVYEEVSQHTKTTTGTSEEDFADEEGSATSSVRGSTGGDLCRDPVSSEGEDCMEPYTMDYRKNQQTYPERTQRMAEPPYRPSEPSYKLSHSTRPSLTYRDPQWMSGQFPVSASQENIYSTIDDEDYPMSPPLTSLSSQRGGGSPLGGKNRGVRGHIRQGAPLSQRRPEENVSNSYGDMMPAFHSSSFM